MAESEPSPQPRRRRNKGRFHKILNWGIPFYEGILGRSPDHVDVLTALGDLYTKRGAVEKGLEVDGRLARLKPDDPIVHYNLACSFSLVNNREAAVTALRKAVELGFRDVDQMIRDVDLKNISKDPRFKDLLDQAGGPQEGNF